MKFIMFTALLSGLAAAAPVADAQSNGGTIAGTIRPSVRSQYYVSSGRIDYNTGIGKIEKPTGQGDITTLLTIAYPDASRGKTCSFHFSLDNTATVSGSGLLDLYTSLAPAPGPRSSWGPGNQRNLPYGRWKVIKGSESQFFNDVPHPGSSFACPEPGTYGYELVGVYDGDHVEYTGTNGVFITYN